jgi:hypothetical protein
MNNETRNNKLFNIATIALFSTTFALFMLKITFWPFLSWLIVSSPFITVASLGILFLTVAGGRYFALQIFFFFTRKW